MGADTGAARASRPPAATPRRRRPHRRAHGLAGTAGVTVLGAVVPGAGFLWARRALLGWGLLVLGLGVLGALGWLVAHDRHATLLLVSDPVRLKVAAGVAAALFIAWALTVVGTYRTVRPVERTRGQTALGSGFVVLLCLLVAAPAVVTARYALVQADLVEHVFQDNRSATAPVVPDSAEDPWNGARRVNILLLGGDGGIDRDGVRTDSMILASMNTRTGATTTFSLPRNLMLARFPEGSPLHDLYPDGFTGPGDDGNWMLNAVYREVPLLHPGILGKSDNEGADAIKLAVEGTLGVRVDYYVLVNLAGFEKIVDAMGGVTVNVNQPIPVGGNKDLGRPPDYYLPPGPDQRLDGFRALWFSRGRWGTTDYARMERQRCMVAAIVDEASPATLIRRYQALAAAGKQIIRTDLPNTLLPALVDLGTAMKEHDVRSVVFTPSARFSSADPDVAWLQEGAPRALPPGARKPAETPVPPRPIGPTESPTPTPSSAEASPTGTPSASTEPDPGEPSSSRDSCAYAPVEGSTEGLDAPLVSAADGAGG